MWLKPRAAPPPKTTATAGVELAAGRVWDNPTMIVIDSRIILLYLLIKMLHLT